ncbi:MAG: glutamate-5-semialdehyde dehydrogenase [Thermodesulfobacteriota bacterium]
MTDIARKIRDMAVQAKKAAREMAAVSTTKKNRLLLQMAEGLKRGKEFIQAENRKDLEAARQKGLSAAMLDRLELSDKVIASMIGGLQEVAALPDPVGEVGDMARRPSGIVVGRMRIPLGVIGMIYESRPNVTVDSAALCLKAGNSILLRGGSEAINSNLALAGILQEAVKSEGVNPAAVQVIPVTDREGVNVMLGLDEELDMIIPRGGEGLIRFVAENSSIPVLKHYKGVCHIFVDESADLEMAAAIVMNGKVQRPGVCNSLETLLVHEGIAPAFLSFIAERLTGAGVEIRGCEQTISILPGVKAAVEEDWGKEFLDLILAVKVVKDLDQAVDHITVYGSQHTEAIITGSYANSQRFLREVDSSSVMVNASTRFSDGGQYGLGAEIGISTTKIHAYGPMGLKELTTRKFIVYGNGEVRE